MKERSIEESVEASNKARSDALKDILPITDNYYRARGLFGEAQSDSETAILEKYEEAFNSLQKVIEVTLLLLFVVTSLSHT